MTWVTTLFAAAAYVVLGRAIVSSRMRGSHTAFAMLNIAAVYFLCFWEKDRRFTLIFAAYLALVSGQYLTLRW